MSDPTKPEQPGSPFPSGPPPQAGSPFPSGNPQPGSPFPGAQNQYGNQYDPNPYAGNVPNVRENAGWKWNPLIGITYNGFPVGLVIGIVVLLAVLAGK